MRILLAASLALLSSAAFAADAVEYVPAPPAVVAEAAAPSWTGAWIGVGTGGQYFGGEADAYSGEWYQEGYPTTVDQYAYAEGTPGALSWLGTVGGGFDYQFNSRFVAGVFGDYTFSQNKTAYISANGLSDVVGANIDPDGYAYSDVDAYWTLKDNWFVGARAGVLANPRTLLYGLVGYTRAKVEAGMDSYAYEDYSISGDGYYESGRTDWLDGVTVGLGSETMLTDRISLKLEYRYTRLDSMFVDADFDNTYFDSNFYDNDGNGGSFIDPDLHSLRASISFRF